MQGVIICGGLATRLRPLTRKIPKSMLKIDGKPFLEYQIEILRRNNVKNIVLCVGFLGEQIKRYFNNGRKFGVDIKYSEEKEELLGTGGALKNAEFLLEDRFFIMYGDSFLLLDFKKVYRYFKNFNKLGLMVVYKNYNRLDQSNIKVKGEYITNYYTDKNKRRLVYIDYGLSIFRKSVLSLISANKEESLNKIFIELIKRKELLAYRTNERFYEIGSKKGLEELNRLMSEGFFDDYLKELKK